MFILNIFIVFIENLLLHQILCCFSLVSHYSLVSHIIDNVIAIILSIQIKKLRERLRNVTYGCPANMRAAGIKWMNYNSRALFHH